MNLTERRAADRVRMANQVEALAHQYGFAVHREPLAHGFMLDIQCDRGVCLSIEFDGKSCQPDVHVIPWHVRGHPDTQLAPAFGRVGGDVNTYHYKKCTAVRWGFDALMQSLRDGFAMIKTGEAFAQNPQSRTHAAHNERTFQT